MISVNSDRLKNPARIAKEKKRAQKEPPKKERNYKKMADIFLIILFILSVLFGAWKIGVFHSIASAADNFWNQTTKAMGLRLEYVQLMDYEIRHEDDGAIAEQARIGLPKKEIMTALGLEDAIPGEYALMALNPHQLKARLEKLSWVQAAAVRRILPNTLRIYIVPRTPFVMLQEGAKISMLDSFGNILPMNKADLKRKLLHIAGKGSFDASLRLINVLAEEPELLEQIKLAERVSGRRWDIYLEDGLLVKMPESDELKAWKKLAELEKEQDLLNRAVDIIDMRLPDRLVVRGEFRADRPEENTRKGA